MTDEDYWKKRYSSSWDAASKREALVANMIQQATGKKVRAIGFGAGSTDFISGSAARHGLEKGAADLNVVGTTIYLEVTGPHSTFVKSLAPLWLRPDKVANAEKNMLAHETWVVHCLADNKTIRVIKLDKKFFDWKKEGQFTIVNPRIRGTVETYLEIPSSHPSVMPFSTLIRRIQQAD